MGEKQRRFPTVDFLISLGRPKAVMQLGRPLPATPGAAEEVNALTSSYVHVLK